MSIVSLHGVSLYIANNCILDGVDLQIQPQDKIALVGRNGAGKSTLLRLLQGQLTVDKGQLNLQSGLTVAYLTQEVPVVTQETVYHFLVKNLPDVGDVLREFFTLENSLENSDDVDKISACGYRMDLLNAWHLLHKIKAMANNLGFEPQAKMKELSGGLRRRVLLASVMLLEPDLLLLDEPTNHLDLGAIEWLETYLKSYRAAFVVVTHDREFLNRVASSVIEIDRGKLYRYAGNYENYLEKHEARLLCESKENALFDRRLSEEEVWIRTGVQARRTRNEGRVRALKAMREQYKTRHAPIANIGSVSMDTSSSGALVIDAKSVCYSINEKKILRDFSLLLMRGDKLGIIGPNGCGKTTLLRLLLGELSPDSGTIRQGSLLNIAYFDQEQNQLDEEQTLMQSVADGAEYVVINGKQKHVASYLREFLFESSRFNQKVASLSGGERNRLLLSKLFAKPVNLLVMDEPTNDLDIETLELLETLLIGYSGTLLLISHDRAFINHVVTSVLVFDGDDKFNEYVGGFDDYQRQKKLVPVKVADLKKPCVKQRQNLKKLSFNEQRELSELPGKIEILERKITKLQLEMSTKCYNLETVEQINLSKQELIDDEIELTRLYSRWEKLEL